MILNEDLFDDILYSDPVIGISVPAVEADVVTDNEIEPEGPAMGEDTGIANIIHDLIIDENEAIQGYNNAAANMEKYPELQKIMYDIAGEEYAHIGELQKALELIISPNASNIAEGEVETEENLDNMDPGSPVDEALHGDIDNFNSRFNKLSKEKQNIVISKDANRHSCDWEDEPENLEYERKYKDDIDAYNIKRYGFTW